MKKLLTWISRSWIVSNWKTSVQWRRMTGGMCAIFGALEIGIQITDRTLPTWPYHFGAFLLFYFLIATPLAYLCRNNP